VIVPTYWAEGRVSERKRGKQVTVRRFGWSDESQAAAQAHADERARDAFERVQRGETDKRYERKVDYNGADGLPIREEIVERHGDTVITRNSYGARCLNTPNVLFADIDVRTGGFDGWLRASFGPLLKYFSPKRAEDPWVAAERTVREYIATRPRELYRLYRTPAGFRLLAMHRTYASDEPEVARLFSAIGVDPIYALMCTRQRCFRARISPKPWRIGVAKHIGPANATWPIKLAHRSKRDLWIAHYEVAAKGHASCRFVAELGDGRPDRIAQTVQRLHDDASRAERNLPLG
jgi:hypothetical protein